MTADWFYRGLAFEAMAADDQRAAARAAAKAANEQGPTIRTMGSG